ncbi:MAG: hypothetical protein HQ580_00630 [Planctomycetes bacterium]|nr:hypothetical protein [Planctomycetota bacterium]
MQHIRVIDCAHYTINVMLCLAILCTGCTSLTNVKQDIDSKSLNFWKPHLLYLQSAVCESLYVEIDAVEGSEPNEETIETLRQRLLQYCDKPGKVQIVCNASIPLRHARATRPEILALRYMDGPDHSKDSGHTAYLYVLFYDSSQLSGQRYRQAVNPHAKLIPYPAAIYMDTRYIKTHHLTKYEGQLLLHEVGHILGLTWSQERKGDWYCHCRDKSCLMYESYKVNTLPFQKHQEKDFCELCKGDLVAARADEADPRLKFMGPVMVRSEKDYHVLSLPAFVKLHFGPLNSIDWEDILEEARNEVPRLAAQPDTVAVLMGSVVGASSDELASLHYAIENAKNDPCPTVRLGINAIKQQPMKQLGRIADSEKMVSKWWQRQ